MSILEGRPVPPTGTGRVEGGLVLSTLGPLFQYVSRTAWRDAAAAVDLIRNGRHVVEHFGENRLVSDITSAEVGEFRATLIDRGLSKATANRKLAALSKMLSVAEEAGVLRSKPKITRFKKIDTRTRVITRTEEQAIVSYWKAVGLPDFADLTVFLVDTGARCFKEALLLPWSGVTSSYTRVTLLGKGGKERSVGCSQRVVDILKRRKKTHGHMPGPFSGIGKNQFSGRWQTMQEKLNLPDVTPHTMRHTCCTRLINRGVDLPAVQRWMGHTTILTTMGYNHGRSNELDSVVSILNAALEAQEDE